MNPRDYCAETVPGLEAIAAGEIARRLPGALVQATEPGRVRFCFPGDPCTLPGLRTTLDVMAHVSDLYGLSPSPRGLEQVEAWAAEADLTCALAALEALRRIPADPAFRITATRQGTHGYRSLQVAAEAGAGIVARHGWRVDLEHPDIDIWVQVRDDHAVMGVRLSTDEMSRHGRLAHGVASTNPTVAHAMCLLSEPQPGQVFLDPMCGAGTVLTERASVLPGAFLVGMDRCPDALEAAARNLSPTGAGSLLLLGNAGALPLARASVDRVVCNMPWGRRVGSARSNRRLYPRFLAEARRVLKPEGVMVLLTTERRLMAQVLAEHKDLQARQAAVVELGGLRPSIYLVRRG